MNFLKSIQNIKKLTFTVIKFKYDEKWDEFEKIIDNEKIKKEEGMSCI